MLLIYGKYRFGLRRKEAREKYCDTCELMCPAELWRSFECGHVFWLPLFPFGTCERWRCTVCGRDPGANYKSWRGLKIFWLVIMCLSLAGCFAMTPKPDEVGLFWGMRAFFVLSALGVSYWLIKTKPPTGPRSAPKSTAATDDIWPQHPGPKR